MLSVAEQLISEGREEGLAIGREEGRAEMRCLLGGLTRESLIKLLKTKFGVLSKQIEKKITAQKTLTFCCRYMKLP